MAGNGLFAEILDGDVYKYYSEGEWRSSTSGQSVAIVNPTTRKTAYKVQGEQYYYAVSAILLCFGLGTFWFICSLFQLREIMVLRLGHHLFFSLFIYLFSLS